MGDIKLGGGKLSYAGNIYGDGGFSVFHEEVAIPYSAIVSANLVLNLPLGDDAYFGAKSALAISANNQLADPTQTTNFRGTQWQNSWYIGYLHTTALNYDPQNLPPAENGTAPTLFNAGLPHLSISAGKPSWGLHGMLALFAADWDTVPGLSLSQGRGAAPGFLPYNQGTVGGHIALRNASITMAAAPPSLYRPKAGPLGVLAWEPPFVPGLQFLGVAGTANASSLFDTDLMFMGAQATYSFNLGKYKYKVKGDDTCTDSSPTTADCVWAEGGLGLAKTLSIPITAGVAYTNMDTQVTTPDQGRINENGETVSAKQAIDAFVLADVGDFLQLGVNYSSNWQSVTDQDFGIHTGQSGWNIGAKFRLDKAWIFGALSLLDVKVENKGTVNDVEENGDHAIEVGAAFPVVMNDDGTIKSLFSLSGMFVQVGKQYTPEGKNINGIAASYSHNF